MGFAASTSHINRKAGKMMDNEEQLEVLQSEIARLKACLAAYEEGIAVEDADNKTAYMFMSNRGLRYAFYSYNIHNPTNWSYYEEDGICFIPEDARLYPLPKQKEKSE